MKNLAKWRSERDLKTEDEYKERIRELELKNRELEETNKAVIAENNAYRDALAKYATHVLLMKQDHKKQIEDLDKKHSKVVSKLECKLDFAKKVYAVDVGENLLDERLKSNSRVIALDKVNARNMTEQTIGEKVEEEGKGQREEEENRTGIFWFSPSYD